MLSILTSAVKLFPFCDEIIIGSSICDCSYRIGVLILVKMKRARLTIIYFSRTRTCTYVHTRRANVALKYKHLRTRDQFFQLPLCNAHRVVQTKYVHNIATRCHIFRPSFAHTEFWFSIFQSRTTSNVRCRTLKLDSVTM